MSEFEVSCPICGNTLSVTVDTVEATLQKTGIGGVNNPKAKLNWDIVGMIRREYWRGDASYNQLAQKYGVSRGTIGRIMREESWSRRKK